MCRVKRRGSDSPTRCELTRAAQPGDGDVDGSVRRRPGRWDCDTDTVMVGNYDVAMLYPLELADGHDGGPGTTIEASVCPPPWA